MVRGSLVEVIPKEPKVSQVQPHLRRQSPLRGDAVEVAQKRHLEDNDGVNRWGSGVAVGLANQTSDESEIDRPGHRAQEVVLWYPLL